MRDTRSSSNAGTNRQSRRQRSDREYIYIEGSAARKVQHAPARREYQRPRVHPGTRRGQKVRAVPMNKGYIAVMAVALVAACGVLMSYVKLQSDITNHISNISKLESQLNEKRLANDETYTKIMSGIDLEEIKRIAINELGMRYAKDGQVIEYTGEGNDYVRQYSEIPQ